MAQVMLGWLGTALQLFGAASLAYRLWSPRTSYVIMLPGALIWVYLSVVSFNWPLAALGGGFAAINSVGIVKWRR